MVSYSQGKEICRLGIAEQHIMELVGKALKEGVGLDVHCMYSTIRVLQSHKI